MMAPNCSKERQKRDCTMDGAAACTDSGLAESKMKKLSPVGPDGGSGRGSDGIPVSNGIETKVRQQASIEHFSSRCGDQMLEHRLNGTCVLCADLCQPQRIERAKLWSMNVVWNERSSPTG